MENNPTYLIHSAKGTHWSLKNHQYIKKIGDKYFYSAEKYAEYAKTQAQKVKNAASDIKKAVKGTYLDDVKKPEPVKVLIKGPKNNYNERTTQQDAKMKEEQKRSEERSKNKSESTQTKPAETKKGPSEAKKAQVEENVKKNQEKKGPSEAKKAQVEENAKKNQQQNEEVKPTDKAKEYSDTGTNKGNDKQSVNDQSYEAVKEKQTQKFQERMAKEKAEGEDEEKSSSKKSGSGKKSGGSKSSSASKESTDALMSQKHASDMSEDELDFMALSVIRGNYGNGQDRKDALGDNYDIIQQRVNEIMRGAVPSSSSGGGSGSTASKANEYTDTGSNGGKPTTRTSGGSNTSSRRKSQAEKYPELATQLKGLGININNMTDFQIEQTKENLSKLLKHSATDCINLKRKPKSTGYKIRRY